MEAGRQRAQAAAVRSENLWNKAPAWRNLVVTASLLTGVALALPLIPQPETRPSAAPVAQRPHANAPVMRTAALPPAPKFVAAAPAPLSPAPSRPMHRAAVAHALPPSAPAPARIASATPQPQSQSNACRLTYPPTIHLSGPARVVSIIDRDVALTLMQEQQQQSGGLIDPDYADNQRVDILLANGVVRLALVPRTMQVHMGDLVTAQENFRNVNLPCNYIPVLITSDMGPQPPAQLASAASQLVSVTPQPQPNICRLFWPSTIQPMGIGRVVSVLDRATVLSRIQALQSKSRGLIDPDYVDNQWVDIALADGEIRWVVAPKTMQVKIGDMVSTLWGYRNVNLPCNFIPNLIVSDMSAQASAKPAAQAAPPVTGNPHE